MYRHILIPTDGSALSEQAIRQGVSLARTFGAGVTALTVSPTFHNFSLDPALLTATPERYERAQRTARALQRPLVRDGRLRWLPGPLAGWGRSRTLPGVMPTRYS